MDGGGKKETGGIAASTVGKNRNRYRKSHRGESPFCVLAAT
jgi:hypothetical protein